MKQVLLLIFLFSFTSVTKAQKYALLDQHIAEPVKYANAVTTADKLDDLLPVEKKRIPEFLKALKEIESRLTSTPPFGKVKQYEIGCIKFNGSVITLAAGERIDYVITSSCDGVRISMHLSDAKLSNKSNAFFIKTWIKYIESYVK
ncbi:hypothetical protein FW778_01200 [Ginsengibacter hankyongi]|uniref:Uncharacterized protein n=1 Tax=Ginsengibacter hankyongi TaxID=2607284 RepID=A0A5J5IID9_9BACT|nr:hypothetical protein [Ginsengibacter hankyongi]KAA9040686.1 hypothetical protein FW778_01200 [Ginsengibacter hankyongi]